MRKLDNKGIAITEILKDRHPNEEKLDGIASALMDKAALRNQPLSIEAALLQAECKKDSRQELRLKLIKDIFEKTSFFESKSSLVKRQQLYLGFADDLSDAEINQEYDFGFISIHQGSRIACPGDYEYECKIEQAALARAKKSDKQKTFIIFKNVRFAVVFYFENKKPVKKVYFDCEDPILKSLRYFDPDVDLNTSAGKRKIAQFCLTAMRNSGDNLISLVASQPNNHNILRYLIRLAVSHGLDINEIILDSLDKAIQNKSIANIWAILGEYKGAAEKHKFTIPYATVINLFKIHEISTSSIYIDIILLLYKYGNKLSGIYEPYFGLLADSKHDFTVAEPRLSREIAYLSMYKFLREPNTRGFDLYLYNYVAGSFTKDFFPKQVAETVIEYLGPSICELMSKNIARLTGQYVLLGQHKEFSLYREKEESISLIEPEDFSYWSLFRAFDILSKLSFPLKEIADNSISCDREAQSAFKQFKSWVQDILKKKPAEFSLLDLETIFNKASSQSDEKIRTLFPDLDQNIRLLKDTTGISPFTIVDSWSSFSVDKSMRLLSLQNAINIYKLSQRKNEQIVHCILINELGQWNLHLLALSYKTENSVQLFRIDCADTSKKQRDAITGKTMELLSRGEEYLQKIVSEVLPTAAELSEFNQFVKTQDFLSELNEQKAYEYCQLYRLFFANFSGLALTRKHTIALGQACQLAKLCLQKQLPQFLALHKELSRLHNLNLEEKAASRNSSTVFVGTKQCNLEPQRPSKDPFVGA